jgi:hypothetical protein
MADDAKLAEFRENNIKLNKELEDLKKRFEGIDPDAVKAQAAELDTLRKSKPDETRIKQLETELATEKAGRADVQKRADGLMFDVVVGDALSKAGLRPEARGYMTSQAAEHLEVKDGKIVGKTFDPENPGIRLTLERFIALQVKSSAFAFHASAGSGANPARGNSSTTNAKELRNPTPQQLGEHADAIRRGTMKVVSD